MAEDRKEEFVETIKEDFKAKTIGEIVESRVKQEFDKEE